MRSLSTLATLLLGLAVVFWAPAAKADCPHNDDDAHQHCGGEQQQPPPVRPQYLGNSGVDRDGDGGLFARHADCAAAFEGALMCTSRMIVEGGAAPAGATLVALRGSYYRPEGTARDQRGHRPCA